MSFQEDFDQYLADFGNTVTVTPQAGQVRTFQAIYANDYVSPDGMADSAPHIGCKTADATPLLKTDTLTIVGVNYAMAEHHPDGTGWSLVFLRRK